MLSSHLTKYNCCYNYWCVKSFLTKIHVLSDSRSTMPRLFLDFFPSVSVQNVLRLQWVITLRYSIGSLCNLVREQTTLSPASCSQKIYDSFLWFCKILTFPKMSFCKLHDEYWAVNLESLGLDTLSNTELASLVLFQSMA